MMLLPYNYTSQVKDISVELECCLRFSGKLFFIIIQEDSTIQESARACIDGALSN